MGNLYSYGELQVLFLCPHILVYPVWLQNSGLCWWCIVHEVQEVVASIGSWGFGALWFVFKLTSFVEVRMVQMEAELGFVVDCWMVC